MSKWVVKFPKLLSFLVSKFLECWGISKIFCPISPGYSSDISTFIPGISLGLSLKTTIISEKPMRV